MEKLTKKKIDAFVYAGGWDVRWDGELTGLGVRIYPSSKKSYVFSYRVAGRKRLLVLGSIHKLTLDEAKNMAKLKVAEVIKGNDPAEERQIDRKTIHFSQFCDIYMERHATKHKKTWKEDRRKIDKHILPRWGKMTLKAITKHDVAVLHGEIGAAAPYEANRTLRLISSLFELAKQWGYLDEMFPNPARHVKMFKEEKRDRWVHQDEIPALMAAIQGEANLYARMAILLYLFTGARKSELLMAKWADIDQNRKELRLEDTKAGRVHYIPLSAPAMEFLATLPKMEGNPYLFPGHIRGQHLVNISKPWNRMRKAANLEDVRLHDLRRTVGSWLAQSGKSLHLIGKVLNHSNQRTTETYARFAQNDARDALEEHGKAFMELVNGKTEK